MLSPTALNCKVKDICMMMSFDWNYQDALRCNLCNADLCHARIILHKRRNSEYDSLPQSILVVAVNCRHHANALFFNFTILRILAHSFRDGVCVFLGGWWKGDETNLWVKSLCYFSGAWCEFKRFCKCEICDNCFYSSQATLSKWVFSMSTLDVRHPPTDEPIFTKYSIAVWWSLYVSSINKE